MISQIEYEIVHIEELTEVIFEYMTKYMFNNDSKESIDPNLEVELSNFVDEKLNDDLFSIVEFPYVDKVYRDSFYSYFSSKHMNYQRDCIRVSLFSEELSLEDLTNFELLKSSYLGYFIIRPLKSAFLGRALISPKAFKENGFKVCLCSNESMVLGHKIQVQGFPHSSQDGETITCAETTIWGLMDYFGNKYAEYSPALPSKIISTLKSVSMERQLPSKGLNVKQISYTLREFGFGTKIYSEKEYGPELFNIIDTYIESGIPVILALESSNFGHAITCVGKKEKEIQWDTIKDVPFEFRGDKRSYYDASTFPNEYVVQDDNLFPYEVINLGNPGANYPEGSEEFNEYKIDSIVVPLYPKIYLEVDVAKALVFSVLQNTVFGFDFGKDFVLRLLLGSSRSFKKHIMSSNIDTNLKFEILKLRTPKFIWIAEIYSKEDYLENASGIIILDATEANQLSVDALIFASYPDRSISMSDNYFVTLKDVLSKYSYFSNIK